MILYHYAARIDNGMQSSCYDGLLLMSAPIESMDLYRQAKAVIEPDFELRKRLVITSLSILDRNCKATKI